MVASKVSTDIALYLWFLNLIVMIILVYLFIRKYRRDKIRFYLGIAFFYFLYFIARIFEIIRFYFNPECVYYNPICAGILNTYPLDPQTLNFWLKAFYSFFSNFGIATVYFSVERYMFPRTRYFFTISVIITAICAIGEMLAPGDLFLYIAIPFYIIILLGLVGMYIYTAAKSVGKVRWNAFLVAVGFFFFEVGMLMAHPNMGFMFFFLSADLLVISAPILMTLGVLLQIRGFETSVS